MEEGLDENSIFVSDQFLPEIYFSSFSPYLPILPYLFPVLLRGNQQIWRYQGRIYGVMQTYEMPSFSPRRL
jgi:hypothetical protein